MKDQVARTAAIVALLLASCTQISAEPFAATSAVAAPMDSEREISAATPTTTASLNAVVGLVAANQMAGASPSSAFNQSANSLPNSELQPAVRLPPTKPNGLTVLYAGHSFGRPFASNMAWATGLAGIVGHELRVVSRGGENGTPQAMWEDSEVQALIKEQLNDGAVDIVVLICCSEELLQTGFQRDEALLEIVAYALRQNPETRFRLAMPWEDYPKEYATAAAHRARTDAGYPQYQLLAETVSAESGGAEVLAFYHGAAVYEIRGRYEIGLIPELTGLIGAKATSVFTDKKGHAASMAIDAGTLIWLSSLYGVHPFHLPPINAYDVDIRAVAATALSATV